MLSYTEASTIPEASGSRSTPGPTPGKATTGAETSTVEMPSTSPLRRATPAKGQASPIHTKTQPQAGPSTTPSRAAMARTLAERARTTPFTPRRRGASGQGGDVTECGKNLRARKSVNYKEIPPEPFKSGERTTAGKKDSDGPGATQRPPPPTQAEATPVVIKRKPSKDTATRPIKRKPSKEVAGTPIPKPPKDAWKDPTKKRAGTVVEGSESEVENRGLSDVPAPVPVDAGREKEEIAGQREAGANQAGPTRMGRQERRQSPDPLDVMLHPPVSFTTPILEQHSQMSPDSTPPSALQGYDSADEDELNANIPRSPTKIKRKSRGKDDSETLEVDPKRQKPNNSSSQTSSSTLHPPPHIPRRTSSSTQPIPSSSSLHSRLATKSTPLPSQTVSQELATYYHKLTPPPPSRPNPSLARHAQTPLSESTTRPDLPATPPTSQESIHPRSKSDLGPRAGSSLPRPLSFGPSLPKSNSEDPGISFNRIRTSLERVTSEDNGPLTPSSSQPYESLTQIADLQHQFADSLTDMATLHIPLPSTSSGDGCQSEPISRRISELKKELKNSNNRSSQLEIKSDRLTEENERMKQEFSARSYRLSAENEKMKQELIQAQSLAINKTAGLDHMSQALHKAEKALVQERGWRLAESEQKGTIQAELEEVKTELKDVQRMFRNAFDLKEKEKKRADAAEQERDAILERNRGLEGKE